MNNILCLTDMQFQNHLGQKQGIVAWWFLFCGISQHRHYKYFNCSIEKTVIPHCNTGWTYSIFVKRIAGILKREQVVYRCMA